MPKSSRNKVEDANIIARGQASRTELQTVSRALASMSRSVAPSGMAVSLVGPDGKSVPLPQSLVQHFTVLVDRLVEEDAVRLVAVDKELSPQEAANILNVSRQYVMRLLNGGEVPSTQSRKGAHRKIREQDVLEYKAKRDAKRRRGMRDLIAYSEETGGYEKELARLRP